uniref:Uncharacterized protein n=1 Tax=uncultured Parcubacteria bacterium Rifle_16ft_4_minimus_37647 TaxID=1665140 RepID=A0A0H4T421_9BACT|nr:hypothetical protein [uncultured Parcubacteria bacterium Rifle_16ft_4_minimus_37647]
MKSLIKKPSAWIPIVLPLIFFVYLVTYISMFGIVRQEDEGTGAHLFQLWLALEPFMLGFSAFKWFSSARKETLIILAIQIAVALLPISVVFSLGL